MGRSTSNDKAVDLRAPVTFRGADSIFAGTIQCGGLPSVQATSRLITMPKTERAKILNTLAVEPADAVCSARSQAQLEGCNG